MSKLRKALERAKKECEAESGHTVYSRLIGVEMCVDQALEALDAPSDMDKLVEWLEGEYGESRIRLSGDRGPNVPFYKHGEKDTLERILKHIRTIGEGE